MARKSSCPFTGSRLATIPMRAGRPDNGRAPRPLKSARAVVAAVAAEAATGAAIAAAVAAATASVAAVAAATRKAARS